LKPDQLPVPRRQTITVEGVTPTPKNPKAWRRNTLANLSSPRYDPSDNLKPKGHEQDEIDEESDEFFPLLSSDSHPSVSDIEEQH